MVKVTGDDNQETVCLMVSTSEAGISKWILQMDKLKVTRQW